MANNAEMGKDLVSEEPTAFTATDVDNWLETYRRLIDFTEMMLERTRNELGVLSGPARRHVESTNIRIMDEELLIFRERQQLWKQRARDFKHQV